ncbi:unnamed protein product [Rotaria socialis]|uniref:SET domain-containing protein n=1 Tax=Rotaria socialis TaxID=392032 RepID=A0A820T305_9BILA|nr:unnamed protein product [Rotaria socialis]CAF3396341.1 unnamed protein product [Rotaria socialis]CAF3417792.1 unnamed protein product [Rotaria socialis]CAF4115543.1 unnamed protein product [Rotaria socialis]CAF4257566.1 unnamed protein product [Rotaria socialis]
MSREAIDKLVHSARELLEAKDYLGARELYTQGLKLDPFDATLWNYRSNVHMKLQHPELAFTDAARGLKLLDDKLAQTNLSLPDRNFSVFMKIDLLFSCLLAAENLNICETALQFIDRLLTNSHLLSNEARQTILSKQKSLKRTIKAQRHAFVVANDSLRINLHDALDLGTMRMPKYSWNEFEPFNSENDIETQLNEINIMLEPIAPKLLVVRMPDNPTHFDFNKVPGASSSEASRPQLGIIAREKITRKEKILDEPGIFINNGLYGPKCNYCNNIVSASKEKPVDIDKTACAKCEERFCSVQCCELALKTYHQAICGRDISEIMEYVARGRTCSSLLHLFAFRVLAMAVQSNKHPLEMSVVKYLSAGTKQNVPWNIYYSYLLYLSMLKTLGLCQYRDIDKFDFWVYYTLQNKLQCNVFGEYKAPQQPENGKLLIFNSFLNHSCAPNAVYFKDRHAHQVVVACEDIEKYQQVFISYIDPNCPVSKRQQLFEGTFGFTCACERCVHEIGAANGKEIRKQTSRSKK